MTGRVWIVEMIPVDRQLRLNPPVLIIIIIIIIIIIVWLDGGVWVPSNSCL